MACNNSKAAVVAYSCMSKFASLATSYNCCNDGHTLLDSLKLAPGSTLHWLGTGSEKHTDGVGSNYLGMDVCSLLPKT